MIRLIKNCLVFFVVLFVVDKFFLPIRSFAPDFQEDKRLEKLLEGNLNKELLVIGSSRGPASIVTWQLEDALGMEAFNLSYGGSEIEFHLFLLKNLLENNTPPKVIIKIVDDDFELTYADMNSFRVDMLYPLVKYPVIREELIQRGEKNRIMSSLFITHQLSKSAYDFRQPVQWGDTLSRYGTMPSPLLIKEEEEFNGKARAPYSQSMELPVKIKAFKEFQALAASKGVKIVYVIPPSFWTINNSFVERMQEVIEPSNLFYVHDTSNPVYQRRSMFKDSYHLNRAGAEYFTHELSEYLKEHLQE